MFYQFVLLGLLVLGSHAKGCPFLSNNIWQYAKNSWHTAKSTPHDHADPPWSQLTAYLTSVQEWAHKRQFLWFTDLAIWPLTLDTLLKLWTLDENSLGNINGYDFHVNLFLFMCNAMHSHCNRVSNWIWIFYLLPVSLSLSLLQKTSFP